MTLTPFTDQLNTINMLRESMKRNKNVLLQCATGWGKTYAAAYMIQQALSRGKRMIFTVPRKMLLKQTSDDFNSHGIHHSFIASGREYNPYAQVWIGMIETMSNRLDSLPDCDVLFVDEVHFGDSALDAVINHYKAKGAWIIGLTGTPWRMDGKGLGCWFDDMVQGAPVKELIEMERLSDYKYYAPNADEFDGKIVGDDVDLYRQYAEGLRTIGFYASVKKAEEAAQKFNDAGIPAASIDGRMKDDERRDIIIKFAKREIHYLSSCQLLIFGFDLSMASGMPVTVEAMIDQDPTQSLAKQGQKNGRVLRKKETPAVIIDQVMNWKRHGLPKDDREWMLEDLHKTEKQARKDKSPRVIQCDNCFYCFSPADFCPECGSVVEVQQRKIDQVDGELQEIDEAAVLAEKKQKRMEVGMAKTVADLRKIAKERGYKNGWIYQQMKIKKIRK